MGSIWFWQVSCVCIDGAKSSILSASKDGTCCVWDAASLDKKYILRGHHGEVTAAKFSSDGTRIVTAGEDGTVRVVEANSGARLTIYREHVGAVFSVDVSPDGQQLVSVGQDSSMQVCDANTGKRIRQFTRAKHAPSTPMAAVAATGQLQTLEPDGPPR